MLRQRIRAAAQSHRYHRLSRLAALSVPPCRGYRSAIQVLLLLRAGHGRTPHAQALPAAQWSMHRRSAYVIGRSSPDRLGTAYSRWMFQDPINERVYLSIRHADRLADASQSLDDIAF